MTPQTYELTAFSTCVVLVVAAVFLWLLAKLIISLVLWILKLNGQKEEKEDKGVNTEDKKNELKEETEELPDLETKKGS